jgi:hypothetical protein
MGFKFLTCCDRDFLAGGILCVALNLILRCKFSQNLPTNDSLQKDPVKLQVPENCILPGFFKDFAPTAAFFRTARPERVRHSKFQSDTIYESVQVFLHLNKDTPMNVYIYTHTSCGFTQKDWQVSPFVGVKERKTWFKDVGLEVKGRTKSAQLASLRSLLCKGEYGAPSDLC